MSIPTKKHSNLIRYGRILIADHESRRNIRFTITAQPTAYKQGKAKREKRKTRREKLL